ncbi:MAG: hypothetical protein HQ512_13480 [Rhodospirillales bacterium]|nr:hypothetical protein [Rhodospirillales bacterium]
MVIEMHKTPAFQLSGIKLGMTLAEVESVYPEIIFFGKSETGITGKFKLGNGVYNIGFNGPLVGRQAHTIGYRESFWNLSEIELRQRLVSKFGTPAANKCERVNPNLGWQCSLDWKRQDGVGLEAKTRTVNLGNGVRKSELVFVATDPVIKNRFAKKLEESKGKSVRKADKAFKKRMKAISSAARNF